jgi:DNA uptake protein ComE-like DNA-binding protein
MRNRIIVRLLLSILTAGLSWGAAGCNWSRPVGESSREDRQERDEKTRDDVARATERLKPELQAAARELGKATERAAEEAGAAAQGVKDGWTASSHHPLDLNSASEKDLTNLSGISLRDAQRIVLGRPYREKRELVTRHILSESRYNQVQDEVAVR